MSADALSWAWKTDLSSSQKIILLALANYADQEASCFPGHERLSQMTGMSTRSVGRNLRELESMGVFRKERRARKNGSGRTSDRYYLNLSWVAHKDSNATDCHVETNETDCQVEQRFNTTNSAVSIRQNDEGYISEPIDTSKYKTLPYPLSDDSQAELTLVAESASPVGDDVPKQKRGEYPPEFAAFWEVYPKKADKRAALKAWRSARKRVSNEVLVESARQYRDDPNRVDQFTKNPATWLNKGSWENGPLPARNGNNRAQERLNNNLSVVQYFAEQENTNGNFWGELER